MTATDVMRTSGRRLNSERDYNSVGVLGYTALAEMVLLYETACCLSCWINSGAVPRARDSCLPGEGIRQ